MSDSAAPSQPLPSTHGPAGDFQAENAEHAEARDATPAAIPPECCQAEDGEHSVLRQPPARPGRPEAA
jgi:hypothetical protein